MPVHRRNIMAQHFPWEYDEFKQVGKNYADKAEARNYDARHADFRDIEAEGNRMLDTLGIKKGDELIDFGSGTGAFAIQAAQRGARVHGVDVSLAMIDQARAKSKQAGVSDIAFHHAGFLTYTHDGPPVDAIVTTFAFHHLPDLWKGIALKRMSSTLKPGGQLYIHDVIIEEPDALANVAAFIEKLATAGGNFLRVDIEVHFRDEYSTYDWVMDGLLTRAGFTIQNKHIEDGVLGTYVCTKNETI